MRILLSAILLFCFTSCSQEKKPPVLPPTEVTIFKVEPKTIPVVFEYVGFAESSHSVEIRARVEGYLDKIAYEEGQVVKEGDLLFQLDPKQYQAKVEQARGEVARQEAILENARLTVNRLKPLYEQKAASKKDLDNAVANLLSAEASLLSAKANLLDNEINLGYTTIRSPITGYTDKSRFREGALITPGIQSLLTTVSVLDPIWVYFPVSEGDILRTQLDKNIKVPENNSYDVEVILSDGTKFPYKGKVDFSSPTYDQSTGTILGRAVLQNPHGGLRPGQFVHVKVFGIERPKALFVPQRALLQNTDGMFVYLVNKGNQVTPQAVSTGEWFGEYQVVTNGLKPGDIVVVDGINKILPGMQVTISSEWTPPSTKKSP